MFSTRLITLAKTILARCNEYDMKLATAESCTGGLISACLTEIAGSSSVVDRAFITYSNEAKRDMLGVPGDMIADYGAVSEPVARAMADGALERSNANIAVSVTGVAGPGGGTPMKPVGRVHMACAMDGENIRHDFFDFGDIGRDKVRERTVEEAMVMMLAMLDEKD